MAICVYFLIKNFKVILAHYFISDSYEHLMKITVLDGKEQNTQRSRNSYLDCTLRDDALAHMV